jgi:hypothetical protein
MAIEWEKQQTERCARLEAGSRDASGKVVASEHAKALLVNEIVDKVPG